MKTERLKLLGYRLFKIIPLIATFGLVWFVRTTWLNRFPKRLANYKVYYDNLRGKDGIEIGGPSRIFERGNILPVYPIIRGLEHCNIKGGAGIKYQCDASELSEIPSKKYDFVISSHTLEHFANPLKALSEWLRILKDGGILLLILPDKNWTVDHKRPITSLGHLIEDHKKGTGEDDASHFKEIAELTDMRLQDIPLDSKKVEAMLVHNHKTRGVHQHVFDTGLVVGMFDHLNLQVLSVDQALPFNIIVMGKKRAGKKAYL